MQIFKVKTTLIEKGMLVIIDSRLASWKLENEDSHDKRKLKLSRDKCTVSTTILVKHVTKKLSLAARSLKW